MPIKKKPQETTNMKDLYLEHIDITAEVKNTIASMKVVFPAIYGKLYTQMAHERNIDLSPEELLTSEMLDERMVRHVISLAECTDQAIIAIERQDKSQLENILNETKILRQEIQELQKIVYEDYLTKSYNRKWFDDTILNHNKIAIRGEGTIVMVDMNKFKEINDTYGHMVGDKVLIHVAEKLKQSGARVVRYGGDEFLLIFDSTVSFNEIEQKMELILKHFQKILFKFDDQSFKISFAYGISPFQHGSDIRAVIERADKSMYRYKRQ